MTPHVLLGSVPLKGLRHDRVLVREAQVTDVLAIMEPFELGATTLVGSPVAADDWKKVDVSFHYLSSPDFTPPAMSILHQGADTIHEVAKREGKIYVHCKSGIGRSASLVLAYLVKHKKMRADDAHAAVARQRSYIISKSSWQWTNLLAFEKEVVESRL